MTDTMAGGRSGVGIRLFVMGEELVKRAFNGVADSGKKMWAEIALGQKAASPAMRALSAGSNEVRDGITGLADRAGAGGRVLSAFGVAGVAAAAALGGLAVAVVQAREAMAFADEIDDAANKLQIGTDALQEYRYALRVSGGEAQDFDKAVAAFTKTLGAAQSGLSPRAMRPFAALGFTRDQLQSFDNGEEALDEVAKRIAALSKESERAAVAEKLGLAPMLPLLRQGADEMEALRQKAQDLGLVLDEDLVKTGAEAADQMETLSEIMKVQLADAVMGLSDEIVAFTGHMADALKMLNDFLDRWGDFNTMNGDNGIFNVGNAGQAFGYRTGLWDILPWTRGRAQRLREGENWALANADDPALMRQQMAVDDSRNQPPPEGGGDRLEDTSTRRSGRSGTSQAERGAKELQRDRERALKDLEREGQRAERDAVRARHSGETADVRLRLAQETARLQREEREAQRATLEAELKRTNAVDETVQAALDSLKALDAEADALADRAALEEHRKDLAAEALRRDQAAEQDALALLDIEAQLATTRQEQFRIERRILLLRQAAERRALEAAADEDGSRSPDEQAAIARLNYRQGQEVELFDRNERDRQRENFKSFGYDIADAIKEKRVGAWIADEMQARLLDMALNGLFDFLFPSGQGGTGGGSGGGGWWGFVGDVVGSMFGGQGSGRAGGGGLMKGLRHPVVETGQPELMMIGGSGHITSGAETARMLKEMIGDGANAGRTVIESRPYFDLRGAVMTEDLLVQMDARANQAAAQAEQRAVRTSLDLSRRGAPGMQARMHRLGTT